MAQNIPNGDFEIWTFNSNGMPQPQFWETQNEFEIIYVESMPGYKGNHAACINVQWDNMLKKYSGGSLNTSFNITQGIKYLLFEGYIKGNPDNIDSLNIEIKFFHNKKLVGKGETKILDHTNNWKQFAIQIFSLYDINPENASISIWINPEKGNHFLTTYCLDNLQLIPNTYLMDSK